MGAKLSFTFHFANGGLGPETDEAPANANGTLSHWIGVAEGTGL